MATFKFDVVTAVFLALFIVENQANLQHGFTLVQDVHAEALHVNRNLRQAADCNRGYPTCNISFPTGPGYMPNFTALNAYYDQYCTAECIDAQLSYLRACRNYTQSELDLISEWYFKQLLCGKNGDDYCSVFFLRNYNATTQINLLSNCRRIYNVYAEINCTTANSTCLQEIADFSSKMGCCTTAYLGPNTVSSCTARGINIDPTSCPSTVSSSTVAAVLSVFTLLTALIIYLMV